MSDAPQKPRTRPLVRAMFAVHIGVTTAMCASLIVSAYREAFLRSPAPAEERLPFATCASELAALQGELTSHLGALPTRHPADTQPPVFHAWSRQFRERLHASALRCRGAADATESQRRAVEEAAAAVERLLDLSEVHVTHWSRHIGPAADRASAAVERLATPEGAPRG